MQSVDETVLEQICNWIATGTRCWLATVVATWGSSPRPVGSLFACNDTGQVVGSLSGGCVEDDLLDKLTRGELAAARAQFFQYGATPEESEQFGLPCGGSLYITIEPIKPDQHSRTHFQQLRERLRQRKCVQRQVDLRTGTFVCRDVEHQEALLWDETAQQLTHTFGPSYQLFIIGAGMVSKYLAEMARMLDYEITVCDPREHLLTDFDVPGVRLINDMPDDAVRAHAADPSSAIVALTHDPRIDDMGLMEALHTDAFYVGAMGSSRTSAARRERLAALDLTPAEIDCLHAPIGLDIGSKTPPEIAIAILAEITAVRNGRRQQAAAQLTALSAG